MQSIESRKKNLVSPTKSYQNWNSNNKYTKCTDFFEKGIYKNNRCYPLNQILYFTYVRTFMSTEIQHVKSVADMVHMWESRPQQTQTVNDINIYQQNCKEQKARGEVEKRQNKRHENPIKCNNVFPAAWKTWNSKLQKSKINFNSVLWKMNTRVPFCKFLHSV